MIYRFGEFELDPAGRALRSAKRGQVALTAKAFDVLLHLVEHRGRPVDKEGLLEAVWSGVVVEEGNLKQTISVLRRCLGDDRRTPRYIVTIPGRGYQFIAEVEAQEPTDRAATAPVAPRGFRAWLARRGLGSAVLLVVVVGFSVWALDRYSDGTKVERSVVFEVAGLMEESDQASTVPAFADRPAIAVMPLEVFDADDQHLADGIADDLITRLAVWRDFPVIARGSTFAYRGRTVDARQLGLELLDAWESAHRAWGHFLRLTEADNTQAEMLYQRSVELEPGWSWNRAGLALVHYQRVASQWTHSPEEDAATLLRLAEWAVQLDDNDPSAHHALGHAYALLGRQEEMIASFRRAVALNPSDAITHSCLGRNLAFAGHADEAIVHLEQAMRLSPRDPWAFLSLFGIAAAHLGAGRYEEAIDWASRSLQWQPNAAAYRALAVSYANLGRTGEAREALDEMRRLQPRFNLANLETVFASADPDFVERVFNGLRAAGLEY